MIKIAVDNIENWVFVTGVIRSGTTFVGKVLSLPLQVDYIHEPFGQWCGMPELDQVPPPYLRPGTNGEQERRYRALLERLFRYDFTLQTSRYAQDPWLRKVAKRLFGSRGPFYLRLAKLNPFHTAAVIKDPNGRMLTEYLYREFEVKPVIVVRHPVSLTASLRRVGWWPGVREFARQPALIEDFFDGEPDFIGRTWSDPVLKSAAHWRATYKVLLAQARTYPEWHVVTHEALSADPVGVFQPLYEALDLPWSRRVERKIRTLTEGASAQARDGRVQDFRRNSADIFEMRRDSIPKEERRAIFDVVEDVALQVYSRESFAID